MAAVSGTHLVGGGAPARETRLERFAAMLVRRRRLVMIATLAVSLALGSQMSRLGTDNSVRAWFPPGDPAIARYDGFVDLFGSDEYIVLAFDVANAFSADALAAIDRLTRALRQLDHVEHVDSLTSIEDIGTDASGMLQLGKLVGKLPARPDEVERARRQLTQQYLLRRTVVSDAGDVAAVGVRLEPLLDDQMRQELARGIRETAERLLGHPVHMSGIAVADEETFRLSEEDVGRLLPLMICAIAGLLWLIYRSVGATILSLLVVALSTLCAFGGLAIAGRNLNALVTSMPLILLIVGIWSAVFVLSYYWRLLATGMTQTAALERTIVELARPCFIVNLTTAIGFGSFVTSELPPVRDFGVFTAIGLMAGCVFALTTLPAGLAMVPPLPLRPSGTERGTALIVQGISNAVIRGRTPIVVVALAIFVASGIGITRLTVDENWLSYVPTDSRWPRAVEFIEKHLTPTGTLETVITGEAGSMQDPQFLGQIDAYAAALRAVPSVERTTTLADFLKTANQALEGGGEEHFRLPRTQKAVAQYLLLLSAPDSEVTHYVDETAASTRVTASVKLGGSREFSKVVASARDYLDRHLANVTSQLTGGMELSYRISQQVISTQVGSLALAVPAIVATMALLFRSVRLVPFILTVNLFPVVATLGFMGIAGISLNSGTVLVASIALGLVGDNAVYLLSEMRDQHTPGERLVDAVRRSLTVVGSPAIYSFALTCGGFALLGLGNFRPTSQLGLLTALSLALALFADIVLMPAVMLLLPNLLWREEDLRGAPKATGGSS